MATTTIDYRKAWKTLYELSQRVFVGGGGGVGGDHTGGSLYLPCASQIAPGGNREKGSETGGFFKISLITK